MMNRDGIKDILTQVTSGKELQPDDLEYMQSTFRQEFSATKKKGEIVQIIVKFLEKYQNEDDEDAPDFVSAESEEEDPSRNLKNELNRAFNAFKDSFSIFRAAGQEDPEDELKNQTISEDKSMVWGSEGEDATADFNLSQKEKSILSKNFLKLIGIGLEKKKLFQQTINDWRYKALELKLKRAYLIHKTFFNFRRKLDHKLGRALGTLRLNSRLKGLEEDDSGTTTEVIIQRGGRGRDRGRAGAPIDDYEDEEMEEIPVMAFHNRKQNQGLLFEPTRNMDQAMDAFVMKRDTALNPLLAKTFTVLNRARYMRQVLLKLQNRNRDWAFYTLLNINAKRTRAIKNVNERMKGKLMMALHKNFSKDQIKSSYYKWYIKSNPQILRKLASNMLIKLQLSNTVAAWRMISLVRTHKTRDERAMMLRLAKGLMELMSMTRVHQLQEARNAMQKMNPNHYTRKGKLLEKTLVRLLRSKANKAKQALDRLRRAPLVCQKVFNRIGANLRDLKSGALARLRFNRLSKHDQQRARGLERLREYIEGRLEQRKRDLMNDLKKNGTPGTKLSTVLWTS